MTTATKGNALHEYHWIPQPRAEELTSGLIERIVSRSRFSAKLKRRLRDEAGVRLADLVDSIHAPTSIALHDQLASAGFVRRPVAGAENRYVQEQGIFPAIVLHDGPNTWIDLKVESVVDFLAAWGLSREIEGESLAPLRRAQVDSELSVVERHGYRGFDAVPEPATFTSLPRYSGGGLGWGPPPSQPTRGQSPPPQPSPGVPGEGANAPLSQSGGPPASEADLSAILRHAEAFRLRRREFEREPDGFTEADRLIDAAIGDLGVDRACDLFFGAEREYWQRRNRAGQAQKARQDVLGIGWANHDHHTYRSSREHFARLIAACEKLGFHCRERFYAGGQAGWGAQVLEQPAAGIVIFADVDLSPDELFQDFAHEGLAPRQQLGTVGLWCLLHGEAFLEAGMHHLECQFDFDALKAQLESRETVKVMKPFTDFSYLRQAFTEGEVWPVRPERIDRLLKAGRITEEQARHFRENGAIGSHLENLERNQGFKGFNQTGVSEIIARTDPRLGARS